MICTVTGKAMSVDEGHVMKNGEKVFTVRLEQETEKGHFPCFIRTRKAAIKKGAEMTFKVNVYLQVNNGRSYLNVWEVA